jgi:pheromone shutdown protein TraB
MMKKILLAALLLFSTGVNGQERKKVYLIGSIHSMHLDEKNKYSMTDLLNQIKRLNPDVVCGEIAPEAFETALEGYFPPEAAMLAEMADELNYRFVPVDWRVDYAKQSKAEELYPSSVKEKIKKVANWMSSYDDSLSLSVYDHIHSQNSIKTMDTVYEIIIGDSVANIAHGCWHERNKTIVQNGMNACRDAKRVVFVFGADHLSRLIRELAAYDVEVIIPERMFDPLSSDIINQGVLDRWKNNLARLKSIKNRQTEVGENYYLKIIHSKRIEELEKVLDHYKYNKTVLWK